ncbi:MAG: carbon-nitrogen hydrolase family protein [Planctomycetales bacterium]|nr:carbon-nitrogen hydrolase family protein [Planctomycetales bacterium]
MIRSHEAHTLGVMALTILVVAPGRSTRAAEPTVGNRDLVKVAAVQISGYDKGDLPRENYDPTRQLVPYIDRAGHDRAQLVVFPEYVLGHIRIPGPETDRIAAAAKANAIYVVVGGWEEFADGTFSNAALLFARNGEIAGKYYKTHAAVDNYEGETPWAHPKQGKTRDWMLRHDPEWIMKRGDDLPIFDCDFGRIGVMTCYDGWFPEPARVLSLRGAELILWINGRGGSVEDFIVKSTMFQSHVAMVTTNQAYGSGTMIADISRWPAQILSRAPDEQEAYITATINLKQVRDVRRTSRNFALRRPDLYGDLTAAKATSTKDGAPQVVIPRGRKE